MGGEIFFFFFYSPGLSSFWYRKLIPKYVELTPWRRRLSPWLQRLDSMSTTTLLLDRENYTRWAGRLDPLRMVVFTRGQGAGVPATVGHVSAGAPPTTPVQAPVSKPHSIRYCTYLLGYLLVYLLIYLLYWLEIIPLKNIYFAVSLLSASFFFFQVLEAMIHWSLVWEGGEVKLPYSSTALWREKLDPSGFTSLVVTE